MNWLLSWDGGLKLLALFLVYWFVTKLLTPRPERCCHGAVGRCERCEEEVQAQAKEIAEAKRRRLEIEEKYNDLDDETRNRLSTLVKERAEQQYLLIGPGDLEAAVVRMYERSQKFR